jgi:hypothetical protein
MPNHDVGSDVQTVVLTTDTGHTFTLRFTLRAAGRLFSEAHNTLNSVACSPSVSHRGNPAPGLRLPNTVDGKVI